jgi:acyl carrier protein phosphodiesterase
MSRPAPVLHDYDDVAEILSVVLGRSIDYNRPGDLRYIWYMLRHEYEITFILFSCLYHTMVRLGFSEKLTDDVEAVLSR